MTPGRSPAHKDADPSLRARRTTSSIQVMLVALGAAVAIGVV